MADLVDNITDTIKEVTQDAKDVIQQRFFSPMYFYFLLSWIITNWKFLYVLFSVEQSDMKIWKLHYLESFYPMNGFWVGVWSISKLIIIPSFSTYVFVWWFSQLSEKFYERNETFKLNKETIKRKLDYEEKVKIAEEKRKIREAEDDKDEIRYNDHQEFNEYLDEGTENVTIYDADYLPSEVIYNTDPESYKDKLNKYLAAKGKDKSNI